MFAVIHEITNYYIYFQIFNGNTDDSTEVTTDFDPVPGQYFRIRPIKFEGHIALKFDLYGCKSKL